MRDLGFFVLVVVVEEGNDVESRERFDFVAVAFSAFDFGWDWSNFSMERTKWTILSSTYLS